MHLVNLKKMNKIIYNYRLFGRSKGRKKNTKLSKDANKIKIKKIDPYKFNVIDIGSGYGESTIEFARKDKDKIIIACEKYIDGINNIAEKTKTELLKNVFIFQGNFHQLIDEYCAYQSISEIWILFPDPWPKTRHFKRRLVNEVFFDKLKKYLKKKSTIHIASDSKSYISEILKCVYDIKSDFLWINQNKAGWDYSNLTLPKTKYFKKALKNGLNPFYIKLIKL